jgi:hypothetical protein
MLSGAESHRFEMLFRHLAKIEENKGMKDTRFIDRRINPVPHGQEAAELSTSL